MTMMVPVDDAEKLSLKRPIGDGDTVIVYERHDSMRAVTVSPGSDLQNRFGVFQHSDWVGKPFGSKVFSSKGGFVFLLAPTPQLWTLVLSHRTQILYLPDISFVVSCLEIVPGCVVLESGTGSGSLSTSLARAVGPSGHLFTFDFHDQRASSARADFERNGLTSLITVTVRDIQGEGFPKEHEGSVDAVFLDLPQPWLAIPSASRCLKPDAVLCSFSPCIEQVQRTCETLRSSFTDIRTFEVLVRSYEIKEHCFAKSVSEEDGSPVGPPPQKRKQSTLPANKSEKTESNFSVMAKPCNTARGHTGYLTFARLTVLSN
ncbi:tRNA (Adenine(58)-N(1))-methyltransferase catalytic subunit TRMT61A [Rhynchospora pubera]|uniref:tRNA (adenine(58)-N(1))-methyltransferase n=1 Tax=Rhynchospora pubera TaxID=906938 RepID=A0AAV8HCP2_9POAL|nr:tRNA (Adenine(58)-N(1))-methyltransferase catalytic subunit TRMT61A [Rhynchospora pubera]